MKTLLAFLIVLSVGANLTLVALLFAGRGGAGSDLEASNAVASTVPSAAKKSDPASDTWASLESTDLRAMVKQLRDGGFPPEIVRAITYAALRESFTPRFKALRPDAASQPYWKTATVDARIRKAEFALYREQQKAMRELLGADAEQPEMNIYQNRQFETVPADKLDGVKDAYREFDERRQEIFSAITITPDLQKQLTALDKELEATLGEILSPTELEEFNLRNSNVARQLRSELSAFNPTEEEFRTIFKLQSKLEPFTSGMTPEESRRRSDAQRMMREQIKAALGPARAEEYSRSIDFQYRMTNQLVSRLELPPETTKQVWDIKKDIETRANELRRNSSLPPAERTKQLAALANEATQRVSPLMGGKRGMEPFKQYAGSWIQNLTPRPPPPVRSSGVKSGP